MNRSSLISLAVALGLAVVAVFGVQSYLRSEHQALLDNQEGKQVPTNTIVVAAQPLRFGKIIEPSSLRLIDWPSDVIPKGAYRTIEDLIGETGESRYVMSAIESAEPVLNSKITGPGQRATLSAALTPGMKAISISINDVLGVAGFVLPGDRVDILLTRRTKNAARNETNASTDVLMQGVKVLAIDQIADDRKDNPAVVKTVTFEVMTAEAQKLTLAQSIGTLSLALRNIASADVEQVSPVNVSDLTDNDQARPAGNKSPEPILEKTEIPHPETLVSRFTAVGVYRNAERIEYKVVGSVQ